MIKMVHYFYTLSSWSLVAEDAVQEVRDRFGDQIEYDWRVAITDYGGAGPYPRAKLQFFYDRLERATGKHINLDWWREGYDWLVPDRVIAAARLLGATGNETRLAIARAGLVDGLSITEIDVAIEVAYRASGIDPRDLRIMLDDPQTMLYLFERSREFEQSGVAVRPAIVMTNDLGDRAVLSGIWNAEPILTAAQALLTDEMSYHEFVRTYRPKP
jgi:2-hydroxychromene-2-carboxylate isomerase